MISDADHCILIFYEIKVVNLMAGTSLSRFFCASVSIKVITLTRAAFYIVLKLYGEFFRFDI